MKEALPPLLRGLGTLVILVAAVIAFCIDRQHEKSQRTLCRSVCSAPKGLDSSQLMRLLQDPLADLNLVCVLCLPSEADAPLVINSHAPLSAPSAPEGFQSVGCWMLDVGCLLHPFLHSSW